MRKTTIYLDDADDVRLTRAAQRRGRSRTDLIREAIRHLLNEEGVTPRPHFALGRSGHTDTAARADEVLAGGFGQ